MEIAIPINVVEQIFKIGYRLWEDSIDQDNEVTIELVLVFANEPLTLETVYVCRFEKGRQRGLWFVISLRQRHLSSVSGKVSRLPSRRRRPARRASRAFSMRSAQSSERRSSCRRGSGIARSVLVIVPSHGVRYHRGDGYSRHLQ